MTPLQQHRAHRAFTKPLTAECVQESRAAVEAAAGMPLAAERFRTNVIVSRVPAVDASALEQATASAASSQPQARGQDVLPAFVEDTWAAVSIGGAVTLRSVKPCARCTVPDVDPATAVPDGHRRTTAALRTMRMGRDLAQHSAVFDRGDWAQQLFFAWNCVAEPDHGSVVSVGDPVQVVAER